MSMLLLKSFKFSACHILHILFQIDIDFDSDYHIEITVMCFYALTLSNMNYPILKTKIPRLMK